MTTSEPSTEKHPARRRPRGAVREGLVAAGVEMARTGGPDVPEREPGPARTPLGQLRAALDELVDAGVLDEGRRDGIEYPIWSTVHGLAVLAGQGPLRDLPGPAREHLENLTMAFLDHGI